MLADEKSLGIETHVSKNEEVVYNFKPMLSFSGIDFNNAKNFFQRKHRTSKSYTGSLEPDFQKDGNSADTYFEIKFFRGPEVVMDVQRNSSTWGETQITKIANVTADEILNGIEICERIFKREGIRI